MVCSGCEEAQDERLGEVKAFDKRAGLKTARLISRTASPHAGLRQSGEEWMDGWPGLLELTGGAEDWPWVSGRRVALAGGGGSTETATGTHNRRNPSRGPHKTGANTPINTLGLFRLGVTNTPQAQLGQRCCYSQLKLRWIFRFNLQHSVTASLQKTCPPPLKRSSCSWHCCTVGNTWH